MDPAGASSTDDDVHAALRGSHLGSLPASVVEDLWAGSRLERLPAGSVVHREGDHSPHLDLVVSGLVRVFVIAPDGRTMTIRYVRPGGLLGAISLFASDFALPATIQVVTDARLLRIDPRTVRWAADTDVRVARVLIDELADRVMTFIPEIPGTTFATVRQRLARHLVDLASESPSGGPLVAAIGQQELADAVGTVREVVVRALRELREAGLIRTGRGGVVILDPQRLSAEAYPGNAGKPRAAGT